MNLSGLYKTKPRVKSDYGGMARKVMEGDELSEAERRVLCEDMGQKTYKNHLYFCKKDDGECPYSVEKRNGGKARCNVNLLLESKEFGADVVIVQR